MKVLYGVVGEGMGHATRSRVVLDHLVSQGHEVHVVVSGRAYGFLTENFAHTNQVSFQEIRGLHLVYQEDGIDKSESFWSNLFAAPENLAVNLDAYGSLAARFHPEAVLSDFESWAYLYGIAHDVPVVSIDNMQIINRCRHDGDVTDSRCFNFLVSKLAVKAKLPQAYYYLVSSFFYPPVRKPRTSLVPPILRPEILSAVREPSSHVLVYQTSDANTALLDTLRSLPYTFRVYGMGESETEDNITLRGFSQQGFIDDLRTARAVIAGGGYSLMGEAVYLRVPMLSVPLKGQFEQELNARYLQKLGFGRWNREISGPVVQAFLEDVQAHQNALDGNEVRNNDMLLGCVDELLARIALGEPRPTALQSVTMGDWIESRIADEID